MKLKLPYNEILLETMKEYSRSAQYVVDVGFPKHLWHKRKLHDLTYYKVREFSKLPSQLVCSSRDRAVEILKSVFNRRRYSKPQVKEFFGIRYDARSFSFKPDMVSLSSVEGRLKIPIRIPNYFKRYLSWKVCSADLFIKKGEMFLNVVVAKNINPTATAQGKTVGIDVGINNLAVTSTKRFFNSNKIKDTKRKFRYIRSKLQQKGTRASRKLLKKISGRENRWMSWINHNVSKKIVSEMRDGDTVVMENLKGIRKQRRDRTMNRWLNNWSFFQFQQFVTYKSERKGIQVVKIPARNTSKTCSKCGSLHTKRSRGFFTCLHCGFSLNADLNGAKNIAQFYAHSISDEHQAVVNPPHLTSDEGKASPYNGELSLSPVKSSLR